MCSEPLSLRNGYDSGLWQSIATPLHALVSLGVKTGYVWIAALTDENKRAENQAAIKPRSSAPVITSPHEVALFKRFQLADEFKLDSLIVESYRKSWLSTVLHCGVRVGRAL